jgi:hypothetical protein
VALIPDDTAWPWTGSDVADPRDWILTGDDPAARWQLLTGSEGRVRDDPDVRTAREQVLADPATADLIARLPDWEGGAGFSGHNSPAFAPNLLNLLADMGLQAADDARISDLLDRMLDHQDSDGRFQSFAPLRGAEQPVWGALLCDTHAITEVLVRYGRGDDPRVRVALDRMSADLATTAQGPAWPCRPDPATGFHGPGRRGDLCPQVSIEGLRTFSLLPEPLRPSQLPEVARAVLSVWGDRAASTPYMFGHGRSFKTGKWPATWYSALAVLQALGGYPALWRGPGADPVDRRRAAELVACLIAYTMDGQGRVRPQSTFRGFEEHSFGQKKRASLFATAKVLSVLAPFTDLAEDVADVDVLTLTSSKGGTGTAVGPRAR